MFPFPHSTAGQGPLDAYDGSVYFEIPVHHRIPDSRNLQQVVRIEGVCIIINLAHAGARLQVKKSCESNVVISCFFTCLLACTCVYLCVCLYVCIMCLLPGVVAIKIQFNVCYLVLFVCSFSCVC